MRDDDIDRILSDEPEIIPSSSFVAAVMGVVRTEASAPPIPFPWKRALPGLFAAGFVAASVLIVGVMLLQGEAIPLLSARLLIVISRFFELWRAVGASWITLALVISGASVRISARLSGSKDSLI